MVLHSIVLALMLDGADRICDGCGHLLDEGKQPKPMGNMHVTILLMFENAPDDHVSVSSPRLWVLLQ